MWSFPTLEPVILHQGSYAIERALPGDGEVLVSVGQTIAPDAVIARSEETDQTITLYVAGELGVNNRELSKYVAMSIGSEIKKGEVLARVRRGLRTATVDSPASGTLVGVDNESGTLTLTSSQGRRELLSLVNGEVEQIIADRGAIVRTSGTRLYGIAGFGTEAIGTLVLGSDRPDRELTRDRVSEDWRGSIVLAGMTAGVPALTRLVEVGARGVILGSMPEGDLRRFLAGGQLDRHGFWNPATARLGDLSHPGVESPLAIILTEGFGRWPMTNRIFEILSERAGQTVSVSARVSLGDRLARPEIYLDDEEADDQGIDDQVVDGRAVRLTDASESSVVGTAVGSPYIRPDRYGVQRIVADVSLESGQIRSVPLANIEVIE